MDNPKKVLLFDLDGTLLREDKTISEYTLKTLSKCKEQGFLIGISTSRGEQNCLGFLRTLRPDILISSGGAMVRLNGTVIYTSSFSVSETNLFIETAREICGEGCEITVDTADAHYWNYKTNPKEQDKSWGDSIYTDFSDFAREALKICVLMPDADTAKKLCAHFPELDCQHFSDGNWYKFTKSGVTKEKAIAAICEQCNVSASEMIAFGDDHADIGMLKLCGTGVAMGNAIKEVRDIADDITLSNEEDGAAFYLEKLLSGNLSDETIVVRFYDDVEDEKLKFAVMIAKNNGNYVFCRHRKRNTWEAPGGHREAGENIMDTAKRELYEETGALEFDLKPICVYSVTAPDHFDGQESFGMLFYADIHSFETELHSEIEEIKITGSLPESWTYPLIQPKLLEEAKRRCARI